MYTILELKYRDIFVSINIPGVTDSLYPWWSKDRLRRQNTSTTNGLVCRLVFHHLGKVAYSYGAGRRQAHVKIRIVCTMKRSKEARNGTECKIDAKGGEGGRQQKTSDGFCAGVSGINVKEEEVPSRTYDPRPTADRANDRRKEPPKRPVSSSVRLSLNRGPIRGRI